MKAFTTLTTSTEMPPPGSNWERIESLALLLPYGLNPDNEATGKELKDAAGGGGWDMRFGARKQLGKN